MEQLTTEKECLDLIGKDSIFKFDYACDGVLSYKSVTPTINDGDYKQVTFEVFYDVSDSFFSYDTLENILYKKQLFEVKIGEFNDTYETIYHKKYQGED